MTTNDFDDNFAYSSERPMSDGPILQWSVGLHTTDRRTVVGWLIETAQDDTLDRTLQALQTSRVTIRHEGSGKTVTHWHLESAELLLVAKNIHPAGDGVAFRWIEHEGKQQSKLKVRVFVRALVDAGYTEPLLVSMKSTLTTDMRNALMRLYDLVRTTGNTSIPIYAFWLPTRPGEDVARGKAQTKLIAPIVADVPDPITREWLVGQYAGKAYRPLIDRVERDLPAVLDWSSKESSEEATTTAPATGPQREYIFTLVDKRGWTAEQFAAYADEQGVTDLPTMTRDQATALIESLKRLAEQPAAPVQVRPDAPRDAREAERRFYAKYGAAVALHAGCTPAEVTWDSVQMYLGWPDEEQPTTIDGWYGIARAMQRVAA